MTFVERMILSVKVRANDAGRCESRPHKKRRVNEVIIGTCHSVMAPERVADIMGVGLDKAKLLMKRTTQKGVRTAVYPMFRKYRTDTISTPQKQIP